MSLFSRRAGMVRLAFATCFMGFAVLFAGTAQAAKPVEYVKICSLYGAGFFYKPGTDICIKLGGTADAGNGVVCSGSYFSPSTTCDGRGLLTVDVKGCRSFKQFYYVPWSSPCTPTRTTGAVLSNTSWYWGGFEGGFGAYGGSLTTLDQITLSTPDVLNPDRSVDLSGVTGRIGLTGGADWTFGPDKKWFGGFEGAFDYEFGSLNTIRGIPGAQAFTPLGVGSDSLKLSKTWDFSIGPRIGYAFNNFNLYGTAGIAVASLNITANCGTGLCLQNGIPLFESSSTATRAGWYVGAGFTTGVGTSTWGDGNWRWGGEIRYEDLGTVNLTLGNPAAAQWNFGWKAQEVSAMLRIMHRSYIPERP